MESTTYSIKGRKIIIRPVRPVQNDLTQIRKSIENGFFEIWPANSFKLMTYSNKAKALYVGIAAVLSFLLNDGTILNSCLLFLGCLAITLLLFFATFVYMYIKTTVYAVTELSELDSFTKTYFTDKRCGIWAAVPENNQDKIIGSVALKLPGPDTIEQLGLKDGLENSLELCRMYVDPFYRGTGLATLLLDKAMAHAKEQQSQDPSIKAMILHTLMLNALVVRFYTREEWQHIKTIHLNFYYFFQVPLWSAMKYIK